MDKPKTKVGPDGELLVERFSPIRRVEHAVVVVTFFTMVLTGFPQRYYGAEWAMWLVELFGGLPSLRYIHRAAGYLFALHAVMHLVAFLAGYATRRMRPSLFPGPQDLRDAFDTLLYYLGRRAAPPHLPEFDYRQKFEYVGIVLGGLLMITTGLVLIYPVAVTAWLPGELVPASRVAHSNEALLAMLVLAIWHIYGSHLNPQIFPGEGTIFTGYIGKRELKERHRLEHDRLFGEGEELEEMGG
jgi:formate dehydrogenase subunit gamma